MELDDKEDWLWRQCAKEMNLRWVCIASTELHRILLADNCQSGGHKRESLFAAARHVVLPRLPRQINSLALFYTYGTGAVKEFMIQKKGTDGRRI